jgi:hypothetical protein
VTMAMSADIRHDLKRVQADLARTAAADSKAARAADWAQTEQAIEQVQAYCRR